MKKSLFLLTALCIANFVSAQYVYTIKADSVKITNNCDTAELILENHTQNILGFLYNKGKGRTEFRRVMKLNDSTLIFGADTLVLKKNLANNGLIKKADTIQLGQTIGAAGNPAALNTNREIPLNSNNLVFTGTGKIGIGTNSPQTDLHVHGTAGLRLSGPGSTNIIDLIPAAAIAFDRLDFKAGFPNKGIAFQLNPNGTSNLSKFTFANTSSSSVFSAGYFGTEDTVSRIAPQDVGGPSRSVKTLIFDGGGILGGQSWEKVIFNSRIGISTSTPLEKLHIAGSARITDTLKLTNSITKTDTINYKPLVYDAGGNVFKLSDWSPATQRKSATVTGSSYVVPADIAVVFVNYTSGQVTVTLPTGTTDREITIKNLHASNTVVISGLDSAEPNTISARGAITVKYTGTAWVGINKY